MSRNAHLISLLLDPTFTSNCGGTSAGLVPMKSGIDLCEAYP